TGWAGVGTVPRLVGLSLCLRTETRPLPTRHRRLRLIIKADPSAIENITHRARYGGDTTNAVRQVIIPARCVIDRILPNTAHTSLETDDLADLAIASGQHDPARIEHRQRVTVKVRLSQLGKLVIDPALTKLLARPLATVTIADHVADAIRLQQFGEFISHGLGAKRRPRFAECIDDDGAIVLMGNRKCHAILR